MPCKQWNDEWVAHLYGELNPADEQVLERHLETCAPCRSTFEELSASRRLLQEAAPVVPATPRVVVLRPRPLWANAWAFAAGATCALILFGAGFWAGPYFSTQATPGVEPTARMEQPAPIENLARPASHDESEKRDEFTKSIRSDLLALEQRLAQLEGHSAPQGVDPQDFQQAINGLQRRFNRERAEDLEYVMRSLTAAELRTGSWMDQTQDAINVLAMRQDPRFAER